MDGDYLGFNPTTERIIEKGRWRWGDKDGTWTYYHSNGSLAIEEHYLNGQLEGVRKRDHEHGNLLLQAHYVQGQRISVEYIGVLAQWTKSCRNKHGSRPTQWGIHYFSSKTEQLKLPGIKQNGQWITTPTAYGSDGITKDDEPSITIRELTPEEAQALEAAANTTKQATDWLEKENLREDSRADASNNAYAPFDKAITGLLENALKKWAGLETDNLPVSLKDRRTVFNLVVAAQDMRPGLIFFILKSLFSLSQLEHLMKAILLLLSKDYNVSNLISIRFN